MFARTLTTIVAAFLAASNAAYAQRSPPPVEIIAHDINGVQTGMTVTDANRILKTQFSKRTPTDYVLERGGTIYTLHLDFAGRIYGIDYQEMLGKFYPNQSFTSSAIDRMVAKYGPYQSRSQVGAYWNTADHSQTIQMLVAVQMLSEGGQTVQININLEDRRITAQDAARLNSPAQRRAEDSIHF